jgi:hypothetical protein
MIGDKGSQVLTDGFLLSPYVADQQVNGLYWHKQRVDSVNKFMILMRSYGIPVFTSENGAQYNTGLTRMIPNLNFSDTSPCSNPNLFECGAINHLVVVTDDGETLPGATTPEGIKNAFSKAMRDHLSRTKSAFRFHNISIQKDSITSSTCSAGGISNSPWNIYVPLSKETGGISLDLCSSNWSPLFQQLADQIILSANSINFQQCSASDRSVNSVKLVVSNQSRIALASDEFQYTAPANGVSAKLYISPELLKSKNIDPLSITNIEVNSTLK